MQGFMDIQHLKYLPRSQRQFSMTPPDRQKADAIF